MDKHVENEQEIIHKTREKLQGKINDSEKKKEDPPLEAVVMTRTESFVYFGTPADRAATQKRWIQNSVPGLPHKPTMDLKRTGRCYFIDKQAGSLFQLGAELHVIYDTCEVLMDKKSRERLEAKAKGKIIAT